MAVYDLAIRKENNIVDEVFDYVIQQIEMLFIKEGNALNIVAANN